MGFVKSWGALAGCRVLLGTFEAGLYPGCVYLLGMSIFAERALPS